MHKFSDTDATVNKQRACILFEQLAEEGNQEQENIDGYFGFEKLHSLFKFDIDDVSDYRGLIIILVVFFIDSNQFVSEVEIIDI